MTSEAEKQISLKTITLQKDIDELFAKRKSLVRSSNQTVSLSALYSIRPNTEEAAPILFLLHAPKKKIPKAHDRNKVKRWMREAIRQNEKLPELQEILMRNNLQILLLIRGDFKPSKDHGWPQILQDVQSIGDVLDQKLQKIV